MPAHAGGNDEIGAAALLGVGHLAVADDVQLVVGHAMTGHHPLFLQESRTGQHGHGVAPPVAAGLEQQGNIQGDHRFRGGGAGVAGNGVPPDAPADAGCLPEPSAPPDPRKPGPPAAADRRRRPKRCGEKPLPPMAPPCRPWPAGDGPHHRRRERESLRIAACSPPWICPCRWSR